jgi:hypothetical protein
VSSLISSQSNYPLQTVIKGDSVVILTKAQAKNINDIFESQKATIASYKIKIATKDSLLAVKDTLLIHKTEVIEHFNYNLDLQKRLDLLEHWLVNTAINNAWIYYSWKDTLVYSVDLSHHYVRKDDHTGDIFFYRYDDPVDTEQDQEEPHKYWYTDIIKPKRPKVTLAPILNYKQ